MSTNNLKSPQESASIIAKFFRSVKGESVQKSVADRPVILSVKEDICFGDRWLTLGEVALKTAPPASNEEGLTPSENAVRHGFYEWRMEGFEYLHTECMTLMDFNKSGSKGKNSSKDKEKAKDTTRRALESIIDAAMRLGLLFPRFDPDMVADMRRPTTVVADTNAVEKGGVDFLIRFLYPKARLKVPAIVAMEILNKSDNYFSQRRRALRDADKANPQANINLDRKARMLLDHVFSQAAQRAMLRFELRSDIEIERTPIMSDPLRNAFTPEKGSDWQELNLSTPIKSYCDRLILETARQHLSTVTPGHPVMLMTGDEPLARMALAEGIRPFFFHAGRPKELYGQVLSGVRFNPFTGEVFSIPLQDLVWELAVTFGNARLATLDNKAFFEVRAIDQDLNWQPFHARDDLLRVAWGGFDFEKATGRSSYALSGATGIKPEAHEPTASTNIQKKPIDRKATLAQQPRPKLGPFKSDTIYRFDLSVLLDLISTLLRKGTVPITGEGTPLHGKVPRTRSKYLGFLATGGFITEVEKGIQATEAALHLWDSLKARNLESVAASFCAVPSLAGFLNNLKTNRLVKVRTNAPKNERPSYTYVQIAELCGLALQIPLEGIYGTFSNPSLGEFVDLALKTYEKLKKGEDYVLTGLWLETLASEHGIHPTKARDYLSEAQAAGRIERFTQGSTPDTRYEKHTTSMLKIENGYPVIEKICLYHGDFIIPGKASVSIRLEEK